MGRKRIYELQMPAGRVVSQREFRVSKNMAEYSYARKPKVQEIAMAREIPPVKPMEPIDDSWFFEEQKQAPKQAIFLSHPVANLASDSANFAAEEVKFAPILRETTKTNTEKEKDLPPKIPPRSPEVSGLDDFGWGVLGSLRDPMGKPNSRLPHPDGQTAGRQTTGGNSLNSDDLDDEMAEPLLKKKRDKKPKNQREFQAEAAALSNAGHIVNPLGKVDNRKKELNWKLARDIGPEGAVTTPQLWRHLVKLWDSRFGEGILENMLSHDKSAMNSAFGELKQQFINTCSNFEPTNRELSEYFDWFLDPKRLSGMLASAKYGGKNGMIHFRQLSGAVYIKRFYDEVIARRQLKNPIIETAIKSKADEFAGLVEQMFNEFRNSYEDNYQFALKIVSNGYAMAAQFLHDEKDMTDSECRQRIIYIMAEFIKSVPTHAKAVKHLKTGLITTKEHAPLLRKETCIWFDWEEKTRDLIEVAIEKSGVNIDEQRNETGGTPS